MSRIYHFFFISETSMAGRVVSQSPSVMVSNSCLWFPQNPI